jgi:cation diffusion facilitator CzcD-associated flavoprotein CzcO
MADLDVAVVGAGFAGIYAVHAFRSAGLTVRAFEAGSGIGGTWFWNRYPGARCDVESKDYSYSFSPELEQHAVPRRRRAVPGAVRRGGGGGV